MEEWVCSICLNNEKTSTVKLEPCNHEFHGNCIVTNLRINGPKCPNCRGLDERCKINFEYEEQNYNYDEENYDNNSDDEENYDNNSEGQDYSNENITEIPYDIAENCIFNVPDVDFAIQELLLNSSKSLVSLSNLNDKQINNQTKDENLTNNEIL